jgi:exopolysaccharide biosynthesis polyprenyl glycosylphosphotransferase
MSTLIADEVMAQALSVARPKRAPVRYSRVWVLVLALLDITMFALSFWFALAIVFHRFAPPQVHEARVLISSLICIVIWLLIFERVGLYHRSIALSSRDEFYYTVAALCLGVVPLLVIFTVVPALSTSRLVLLTALALSIVSVGGVRGATHLIRNSIARSRPRRIAIVGKSDRIEAVADSLNVVEGTQLLSLTVDDIDASFERVNLTEDADLDTIGWFRHAKDWGCDTLMLTEMLPPYVMPHVLEVSARHHIKVAMAPPRIRAQAYTLSLEVDGQQALIIPSQLRACKPSARLIKRIFDLVLALTMLVPALPLIGLGALAILIESGRPAIYRQQRVGRGGQVFEILKLRSMPVGVESKTGPVLAGLDDNRSTRIGRLLRRTSIDELPQLFNVIRGEMAIVGPRPERPIFVEAFRDFLPRYDERHLVRPGITGWSQVNMKRVVAAQDVGEKLSFDLFYIEHWSVFMDVSVIFKTAVEFLFQRPA